MIAMSSSWTCTVEAPLRLLPLKTPAEVLPILFKDDTLTILDEKIGPLGAPLSSDHVLSHSQTLPMVDIHRSTSKTLRVLLQRTNLTVTITDEGVISTLLHFSLNSLRSKRVALNSKRFLARFLPVLPCTPRWGWYSAFCSKAGGTS